MPSTYSPPLKRYLLEYVHDTGETMSLAEFICETIDMYLYGEEQNKRIEKKRRLVGLES